LAFSIASCSKEPDTKSPEEIIVGKWSLDSIHNLDENKLVFEYNGTNFYEFREDGTGKTTYLTETDVSIKDIKWEILDDYLIIEFLQSHTNKYTIKYLDNDYMVLLIGEKPTYEGYFSKR
jgi:hypothetical protein